MRTSSEGGKVVISSVTRNTTAYLGGLSAKDEIIAINGHRVSTTTLGQVVQLNKVGDDISVLIARDGIMMTLDMPLMADPSVRYTMSASPNMTAKNRKALEKWLVKK